MVTSVVVGLALFVICWILLKKSTKVNKKLKEFFKQTDLVIGPNSSFLHGLDESPESIEKISKWIENNKNIKSITFSSAIGENWLKWFYKSIEKSTGNIKTLAFKNCHFEVDESNTIAMLLENNKKITSLDFGSNTINHTGFLAITKALKKNSSLKSLNVSDVFLLDDDISALTSELAINDSVTKLNISRNLLMHQPKDLAAYIEKTEHLKHLNLSNCSLHSSNLHDIAKALEINKSLISISFSSNPITEKGCKMILDALTKNVTLRKLELDNMKLESSSIYMIGEFIKKNTKLETLSMNDLMPINKDRVKYFDECMYENWNLTDFTTYEGRAKHKFKIKDILKRNRQEKRINHQFYCPKSWNNFLNLNFKFRNPK
eukprot:gene8749-697_t